MVLPLRAHHGAWLLFLAACGHDGIVESSRLDGSIPPPTGLIDANLAVDATRPDGRVIVTQRRLTSVRVEPPAATLVTVNGEKTTLQLTAYGRYDDGSEAVVPNALFSAESPELGDFSGSTFVANGQIGGEITALIEVPTVSGTVTTQASITVSLQRNFSVSNAPADAATRFDSAPLGTDGKLLPNVVYPLDGVVVPQNVFPLDVQWTLANNADLFRVTLQKPHAKVVAYLGYDASRHWQVDLDAWRALARSEPDVQAELTVERLSAGQRYVDPARKITFAKTALTGSIYYWDIEAVRIQRIDDGSGSAVSFMPNPPVTNDPSACIGCHSVSNSGRYMAGRLGGGDSLGAVFDLTADLTTRPAPTLWPVAEKALPWWFSSWSPDDTRLVVSAQEAIELRIYDPMQGVRVPVTGLPKGTMPDWSPDGTRIAYVSNPDNFGDRMTRGDISLLPVTGNDTFGTSSVIQRAASLPNGTASSYPTWSPDSEWLAFAHGTGARSEENASSIYLLDPNGGAPIELTRALSGKRDDFQPNFSPFQGGGYYWLTFLSRRTYGNDPIGNGTRPLNRRQQIWITAIRTDGAPGEDPSSVPFWLPGQNTKTANISASWAPRACRDDGASCSVGSECCGGDCRPGASGALVCGPPPPERCRTIYEVCATTADCCTGTCVDRVCSPNAI